MPGFRIMPNDTADQTRQREPRVEKESHLVFVRGLSCVVCGAQPVDPAHLRAGNRLLGKRTVGVAEKPSDSWTAPLCRKHHHEQHNLGDEAAFWESHGIINPWQLCLALFAASVAKDQALAERIVLEHRRAEWR